jgi:hypothetical protein
MATGFAMTGRETGDRWNVSSFFVVLTSKLESRKVFVKVPWPKEW